MTKNMIKKCLFKVIKVFKHENPQFSAFTNQLLDKRIHQTTPDSSLNTHISDIAVFKSKERQKLLL